MAGEITGDRPIWEGSSASINEGEYKAESYVWTSDAYVGERSGVTRTESPESTTTYYVTMTRGKCTADDNFTVQVNTKPRIETIDSIGIRDRMIVAENGFGTEPFNYGVDNESVDPDSEKRSLVFGVHRFYIVDALGCISEAVDYLLEAPSIYPPNFFTPGPGGGDGINDRWEVGGLRDVYPEATVTIYDRFGRKLIVYKGGDLGWDGTYNGTVMPSTDYWYEIDIREIDKQYVGHFTLIRR